MLNDDEAARKKELLAEIDALEKNARQRFLREADELRYSFDGVLPEYLDEILRFQAVFGRHLPALNNDEHACIALHQKMMDSIYGNPTDTIDASSIDTDLKRLKKALLVLADHPMGYWHRVGFLSMKYRQEGFVVETEDDQIGAYAAEIFDFLLSAGEMKESGLLPRVLKVYEAWAVQAIQETPARKNINWEAVHAVSRFRFYWKICTGAPPPRRALNPASPFAEYLRDAFEFFEIKGNPEAAFKRWAALADNDSSLVW